MKGRVLITGGGAGIGAACAERCRDDDYEPVVIDRAGGEIVADLTARALSDALQKGPITRLVNNVGIVLPAAADAQTFDELDRVVAVNLRCCPA